MSQALFAASSRCSSRRWRERSCKVEHRALPSAERLLWLRHLHKNAHKTLKEVNDKARLYYGQRTTSWRRFPEQFKESNVTGEQQNIAGDQCRRGLSAFSTQQPSLQGLRKIVDKVSVASDWTFRDDMKLVSLRRLGARRKTEYSPALSFFSADGPACSTDSEAPDQVRQRIPFSSARFVCPAHIKGCWVLLR